MSWQDVRHHYEDATPQDLEEAAIEKWWESEKDDTKKLRDFVRAVFKEAATARENRALRKRVERQQRVIDAAKEWMDGGEYDEPVPHSVEHITDADRLVCELVWFFGEEPTKAAIEDK